MIGKEELKEGSKFFISLLLGLWIVVAFGFPETEMKSAIISACKVLRLNPPHSPADLHAWECWEIGALLWSVVTSAIYYFFTSPIRNMLWDRTAVIVFLFGTFVLHWLAAYYLFDHQMAKHIWAVVGIGVLFSLIDWAIFYFQKGDDPKEKRERREALEALLFADLPMVIAFLIFLRFDRVYGGDKNTDIFLSGAISFQFVASTFVFAFIQGGLCQKVESLRSKLAGDGRKTSEEGIQSSA